MRIANCLYYIYPELSRLRGDIAGLLEVRRSGTGDICRGGYTWYWSGTVNGAISSRHTPATVEVTQVNSCFSIVAVYATTEVWDAEEKEMFYANFESTLDQCPLGDVLVLDDFSAVTDTYKAGY